jgi:MFS family permease
MAGTLAKAGSRLWAPARIRSFRLLWLGQSFSLLGDGFSYIAFSWITLSLTRSTLTLGYVLALQAVPRALLTLVGGSLSDKWSTRRLMALSSWARAAVMTAVAAVGLSGALNIAVLCVAAALFGAVDAFFQPARSSILPSVVAKDLLAPANALLSVGARVSAVLGPAVGGLVVAFSDADYAFLVDGVCFALCGLCVALITTMPATAAAPGAATDVTPEPDAVPRPAEVAASVAAGPASGPAAASAPEPAPTASAATPEPAPAPAPEHEPEPVPAPVPVAKDTLFARILAGLKHAWDDPRIRTMLAVDTAVTFCYAGPFTVGFADLAKFHLQGGSTTLGLLNGALAGGSMLGALVGGTVGGRPRVGLLVAALAGWLALCMTVLGVVHAVVAAVATVLVMGFAIGFQGVFGLSWIQRNIHGQVLSRVISVDMVLGYAAAPISLVLAGGLAQSHTELMFGGTAVILALTALGVLSSSPVRAMR